MERVVYLLGAGFSAPLGLPVMSNFFTKSKDMYYENPSRYPHFKSVFDTIQEMSVIKNYYSTDLFNIEEILSILEMGEYLQGSQLKENFLKYIIDVINHSTPSIENFPAGKLPGNWDTFLFGSGQLGNQPLWESYGRFVGNLCNLALTESRHGFHGSYSDIICEPISDAKAEYSIVTLNYDVIPESVVQFLKSNYSNANANLPVAKLHGSVDTRVIVPPTWSKGVNKQIVPAWEQAFQYLSAANHIRIIGYSLPTTDAYVKYLLKSAVIKANHLKRIDVICLDDNRQAARQRYDDFIPFAYYRFANANVTEYLDIIRSNSTVSDGSAQARGVRLDKLERGHESFFTRYR